MSGSTIQALDIQYLHQPPFDTLSAQQRTYLQQHSKIVYLDNLQPIPTGWQGDFFIILKGCVHQLQGDALISTLNAGDWFDTKDLNKENLNNSSVYPLPILICLTGLNNTTTHRYLLKHDCYLRQL